MVLLDSNQEITTQVDIDFTAGTYDVNGGGAVAFSGGTIADVVGDLNTAFGAGATVSFSNGALTFDAAGANDGVAFQQGSTPSDRGGRGFAHFFGMNDLLSAGAESHYDTGFATTTAHGFGATGITTIELRGPNNDVVTTYALDFSAVGGSAMSDVLTDLNTGFSGYASFSLDSNGALVATPATAYTGYKFNVTTDTTNRASTGVNFSQFFGLGDRYRTDAANNVTVRSDIVADPAKLALADVDLSAATGIPSLTVADGRGAIAFQNLVSTNVSFSATNELAAVTTTLGNFAAQVLARAAVNADQAEKLQSDRSALTKELEIRNDEISGVNMDEELSNMVVYQNAYNASARLVTTAREMFNTLLQLVN
jgi:flagellar hook-associated protein 1 FlgK